MVFGEGAEDARVVFVGEAPGVSESVSGKPFVGASGKLLNKMLQHAGIDRDSVFITNVVMCRPPDNREPTAEEVRSCVGNLYKKIAIIRPRLIVALGRHAARALTGRAADIKSLRLRKDLMYQGVPVIVTLHPAGLMYDPSRKQEAWQDFNRIAGYLRRETACTEKTQEK